MLNKYHIIYKHRYINLIALISSSGPNYPPEKVWYVSDLEIIAFPLCYKRVTVLSNVTKFFFFLSSNIVSIPKRWHLNCIQIFLWSGIAGWFISTFMTLFSGHSNCTNVIRYNDFFHLFLGGMGCWSWQFSVCDRATTSENQQESCLLNHRTYHCKCPQQCISSAFLSVVIF